LSTDPPPPSTLRADLPRALDVWMKKALAKRREDRFQGALELSQALDEALGLAASSEHETSGPPSPVRVADGDSVPPPQGGPRANRRFLRARPSPPPPSARWPRRPLPLPRGARAPSSPANHPAPTCSGVPESSGRRKTSSSVELHHRSARPRRLLPLRAALR